MKSIGPCFSACLLLTLSLVGHRLGAQTLSLSPTSMGSISHAYSQLEGGYDQQPLTFGTPSVQLVNYTTIQVSVNAPAGEAWNVSYNGQGLDTAYLYFYIYYNNSFSSPWASVTSGNLQFDFVNGSSASLSNFGYDNYGVPNSGDRFDMNTGYNVVSDFSFTGFTATITFDNSTLAAAALNNFFDSSLSYEYLPSNFQAPDPGALLTLEATPEPSVMAFIGLGGIGIYLMRRRFLHR